jgi:hypothetical protein
MARFVDRPESLDPPLEMSHDHRWVFIGRAIARHRLPAPLTQLGARGVYVPVPPPASRQAVVKLWPASAHTTGAHLHYLERGKGVDGHDATLFTDRDRMLDRQTLIAAAQLDPHQHRLMFSVIDGDRLDLVRFTQDLMGQVERDVDAKLSWVGAVHHDTTHRHVHVVVRGRDAQGQPLYFRKHYWTHGLRYRVMSLATECLGPHRRSVDVAGVDRTMTAHMWEARRPTRLTPGQVKTRLQETQKTVAAMRARWARRALTRGVDVQD